MSDAKVKRLAKKLHDMGAHAVTGADGVAEIHVTVPPRRGHNSDINPASAGQLKAFIERIERLEEEKRGIAADIKDVYGEAKAGGFDAAVMRRIVALRREDANARREREELLETYLRALGME